MSKTYAKKGQINRVSIHYLSFEPNLISNFKYIPKQSDKILSVFEAAING